MAGPEIPDRTETSNINGGFYFMSCPSNLKSCVQWNPFVNSFKACWWRWTFYACVCVCACMRARARVCVCACVCVCAGCGQKIQGKQLFDKLSYSFHRVAPLVMGFTTTTTKNPTFFKFKCYIDCIISHIISGRILTLTVRNFSVPSSVQTFLNG